MSAVLHVVVPGDIEARTGGYGYDRRLMAELRLLGWDVRHVALPSLALDNARDAEVEAASALAALPDGDLVLVDGLAYALMPKTAAAEARRLRLVALVHHPLALETGLDPALAAELRDSEVQALAEALAVVVTSPATAETLVAAFGVPRARLTVAPPGTDRAPAREPPAGPPLVLSVGSLIPRKGYDVLIDALALLADLDWRCRIVGGDSIDPAWGAALRERAARHGLGERVVFVGGVADPSAEYAGAHVFALPSRYEGYGMVFAEAMAHGLPIIAARAGAVPDVVPETAGILVPQDDPTQLAAALRRLLSSDAERAAFARGARQAAELLPSWRDTASLVAGALNETAR
ncbi:glycosyltransferase family 4 protein [Antarcticirhabdus aurantiaca]|uniref:Glycosyltransferase family 4 protein n=1 Tax=Antarcticirhabdus aurantiaca TaxID=2606717 RepID=A0ACD4NHC8_9HYPH|nr:glycosyltransferase family 4 protein [Antarcticirhabdus aurantiaca]WAJ26168.1 glycosyltransferase family 4 protein [Jeongeuplla avenae]